MPKKSEDKSSETPEQSAAKTIATAYRDYLKNKSIAVEKPELLPAKKEGKELPLTKGSKENEKAALFFHVEKDTPIFFKKSGAAMLFPLDPTTQKTTIHLKLLRHYINKGIDIRPFVLETYLRDHIDKNSLISLFLIQQGLYEFYPVNQKIPAHGPVQIFFIHKNGTLTSDAKTKLLPYLITSSPPFVLTDKQNFEENLKQNLSQIQDTDNFFAYVEIPLNDVYKLAYNMLYAVEITPDIFETGIFKHAKTFFEYVGHTLGLKMDMKNLKLAAQQLKYSLVDLLDAKLLKILADEKVKIKKPQLKAYMYEHMTLFMILVDSALADTGEFLPVCDTSGKFFLPIIGSSTQNAWLKAATGKEPEDLLEKVAMFNTISVRSLHQMVRQRQRPIGLEYIGLKTPDRVHDVISKNAYAYSSHDFRFHYEVLFYLLANARPIYDMQIKFAKAICDTINHEISYPVVNMLDFANSFFELHYKGTESSTDLIQMSSFIPFPMKKQLEPAMLEYAFIIVSDLIKNENNYLDILNKLPGNEPVKSQDVLQFLLDTYNIDSNQITPYQHYIKNYSHSLGAFMCMLLIHEHDGNTIVNLCKKIDELEKSGIQVFKWNAKDGMMVNLNHQSFRFRHPEVKKDYRHDKEYPQDGIIRKMSTDQGWLKDIIEAIDVEQSALMKKHLNY